MKKITMAVTIFAVYFSQNLMGQENVALPVKPVKNNFMMELNFKPFGENVISFNQLQLKYKTADNLALRLGLAFDRNVLDQPGDDYPPSQQGKVGGEEKVTKFGISPGIEYHFLKNSKISPYVGIEFSFFKQSVKSHYRDYTTEYYYDNTTGSYETRYIPVEIDIDGATRSVTQDYIQTSQGYYVYANISYLNRAYTSFGSNLLLGCDFYFMRHLYIGMEAGLSYNYIKNKTITVDTSDQVNPQIIPSFTESKFGFYYNSALRLGFWF
ncbi:MAG: autotransporter outer membrane beta-barrel domain-containing protein [Prevotellaceae bacterium]|jgi:outer membrane protein W|nr:autotransporter outer membrane beta-barrel domain-containing protein [Prevotellaceae bacterium]